MFPVTEITNSVSEFYRIKLRAAVMNSEADTAQQELQPLVYTNVIGPRDWLLFQGPNILTLNLKASLNNMATATTNTSRLSQVLQDSSAHSQSKEHSVCISLTPH